MSKPARRTTKIVAAITTPVALVATAALIYTSSYAAFTGQTRNSGNQWSTGSINLTDDYSANRLFSLQVDEGELWAPQKRSR